MECINCGKQTVPGCIYCRECSLAIVTKLLRQYAKSKGNQMISKQEGVIDEREERMREFHKNLDEAQREQEKKDEENGAVFFIAGQKIILSEDYICIKDIVIEAKKILCGNQERFQNNIYGKNYPKLQNKNGHCCMSKNILQQCPKSTCKKQDKPAKPLLKDWNIV